ncbi:MAG: hypothetical protein ACTSRS_08725 [Candidatus Helarchaeota archaeon]
MKPLVIYSSYFGNTKSLAEQLAKMTDARLEGIVHGGHYHVFLHLIGIRGGDYPRLDLSEFDPIYAGGPVWAGHAAPGFNRLLQLLNVSEKEIRFFFRAGHGFTKRLEKKLTQQAVKLDFKIGKFIVINGNDPEIIIQEKFEELIA